MKIIALFICKQGKGLALYAFSIPLIAWLDFLKLSMILVTKLLAGCPADAGANFTVTGRGGLPPNPRQFIYHLSTPLL